MPEILISGHSGFIGRNLFTRSSCSYVVRKGSQHNFKKYFEIDSLGPCTDWQGAFENIDCVIHLAGLAHNKQSSNSDFFEVNTKGSLHFATEASKHGVTRFIFISSIGVNGRYTKGKGFDESDIPKPHDSYASSKWEAEKGLLKIAEQSGMEVVIIRPSLVYGANAPGNFGLVTKLVKIMPILPFGLVNNARSFISVNNLCDFINTCVSHPKAANQTFVISDGGTVSVKFFTSAIATGLGKTLIQLPVPVKLMAFAAKLFGVSNLSNQLFEDLRVDSSKAGALLGWTPPESMSEAMSKLV